MLQRILQGRPASRTKASRVEASHGETIERIRHVQEWLSAIAFLGRRRRVYQPPGGAQRRSARGSRLPGHRL